MPCYDGVNRLTSASESGGWSRSFGYDAYGNRWVSAASGISATTLTPTSSGAFSASTNRLTGGNWLYDDAGHMTRDNVNRVYQWDAEGRMIVFDEVTASNAKDRNYDYDADGRRVRQTHPSNGATTITVYDAFGRPAAEYSNQAPTGPSGLVYRMADHLGSTRLAMQGSSVLARYDYLPFGERIGSGVNGRSSLYGSTGSMIITGQDQVVEQQFTSQQRDAESGLDYFGARFFMAPAGRFLSADKPFADQFVENPQSWNLYSYTRNNPLKYVDKNGEAVYCPTGDLSACGSDWYEAPSEQFARAREQLSAGKPFSAAVSFFGAISAAIDPLGFTPNPVGVVTKAGRLAGAAKAVGKADEVAEAAKPIALVFEGSPKHGPVARGRISRAPTNGQSALDQSVQVKTTSPRRVGADRANGEIVVLDQTSKGKFHGHVRTWDQLTDQQRNALIQGGFTDKRGHFLPGPG